MNLVGWRQHSLDYQITRMSIAHHQAKVVEPPSGWDAKHELQPHHPPVLAVYPPVVLAQNWSSQMRTRDDSFSTALLPRTISVAGHPGRPKPPGELQ